MPNLQSILNSFNNLLGEFRQHNHTGIDGLKVAYSSLSGIPYTFYAGHVNASGTGIVLPSGWASSISSSTFIITHSLGITNYLVTVTPRADASGSDPAADICFPVIGETTRTYFTVAFFTNNGSSTKILTDLNFIMSVAN